jgi:hypothetical protein
MSNPAHLTTVQDMPYGSFYDLKKSGQKAKAKTHAEFWVAVRYALHLCNKQSSRRHSCIEIRMVCICCVRKTTGDDLAASL